MMNEILKKRIEEESIKYVRPTRDIIPLAESIASKEGFMSGAAFALSHQWISVEEALPEYEEDVLIAYGNEEYGFSHRSNNPDVLTDKNGFCNYGYKEVLAWLPIPKFETKK